MPACIAAFVIVAPNDEHTAASYREIPDGAVDARGRGR